jgi:hypothetical protein
MLKLDLFKFDPLAYILIAIIIALQIYSVFLQSAEVDAEAIIRRSDSDYKAVVFDDPDLKGILQQIFRQNQLDRDLLKSTLAACSR